AIDFANNFNKTGEMWNDMLAYAAADSIRIDKVSAWERSSMEKRLKASLARFRWRSAGFYQVIKDDDPVIKTAITELEKAGSK
ncbi:MAG TPA: hypothetical protein VLJ68_03745, partial [Chitinophagaceae bacterium]|nr:hypothetical protein [Chitinophagaceae bacterium]